MLVVCSLSGAPGVTTTSARIVSSLTGDLDRVAMLAECDASGGDLALRFAMASTPGLATLAAAARRGLAIDDLWAHVQEAPGDFGLLAGLDSAEQSRGLGAVWEECARVLASAEEVDVVVDLGRLPPGLAGTETFIETADAVLVVARPDAVSLVHASRRLPTLRSMHHAVFLVLVGKGPYGVREAEDAAGVEVLGTLSGLGTPSSRRPSVLGRHGDPEALVLTRKLIDLGIFGGSVAGAQQTGVSRIEAEQCIDPEMASPREDVEMRSEGKSPIRVAPVSLRALRARAASSA